MVERLTIDSHNTLSYTQLKQLATSRLANKRNRKVLKKRELGRTLRLEKEKLRKEMNKEVDITETCDISEHMVLALLAQFRRGEKLNYLYVPFRFFRPFGFDVQFG